ncbi:hypothetical protein [Bradyrhizobium murdochi]|uniref:hypothetical protein n=1 Tax=Bradyrhizobium murdochi TaxID=1038859 RepID=UPI00047F3073|nr:hypothetical protein [Bradyrhizobium murdochi]
MSDFVQFAAPESQRRLLRCLTEIAFLACIKSDAERARRIAKGIGVVAPGSREAVIACVLVDLLANDVEAALERLDPLACANDAYGMAFQALVFGVVGRLSERDAVLRRLPRGDLALDGLFAALGGAAKVHTGDSVNERFESGRGAT